MTQPTRPADLLVRQIRAALERSAGATRQVSRSAVRHSARMAVSWTRSVGHGAGHLAQVSVEETLRAVGEISGETTSFVRDAVIGVIEGTEQVVAVTTPAVRQVVVGAIRTGSELGGEVKEVSQNAVEGAIVGAASVGIDTAEAASAAVDAAVEAVVEAGGDLKDAATATIGGVISGVSATGGDVAAAVRDSAAKLVDHAAANSRSPAEVADMAEEVLEAALSEANRSRPTTSEIAEVVSAAADGAVLAAYQVGESHGDRVREGLIRTVSTPGTSLRPSLRRHLSEVADRLSQERPRSRAAWRGRAMFTAAKRLLTVGASDLAGSLAYFTVLSFFPLMALVIISFAFLADAGTVRVVLNDMLTYYFPASAGLFHESIIWLIDNSAALGLIALVGVVVAANGLFMATNRAVNRVFGTENHKSFAGTLLEAITIAALGLALMVSIGVGVFVQHSVGIFGDGLHSSGETSHPLHVFLGSASAILPAAVTGLVFTIVYHNVPHVRVEWKDAAFGGLIALILFEAGKHLFFWLSGLAAQRDLVYGPVASTVLLLMWAYYAGLIFLYGASVTKAAGELRPGKAGVGVG